MDGEADPDAGAEFRHLAEDAGAEIAGFLTVRRQRLDPATCIGRGKVAEIAERIAGEDIGLVLFDRMLGPVQERNLEKAWSARVVDRVGLILDIFARRARTHEGKLQVELAQLTRLRTRLVRGWTHLERQRGGIGLRGPGETQLETDRRLIGERIRVLRARLVRVAAQRATQRRARQRAPVPTVALVGYTNAGKSSLFNALTDTGQYAADRLFATLDPSVRRLSGGEGSGILLADTVGFLRDLPTELIAAFRATLEEVNQAQLLLHVIDGSSPEQEAQAAAVEEVLREIGAGDLPRLLVINKIDRTGEEPLVFYDPGGLPRGVRVSARTGQGLDLLRALLPQCLGKQRLLLRCSLGPAEGALRSHLHRSGKVLEECFDANGTGHLLVEIDAEKWRRLQSAYSTESCQRSDLPHTMGA